MCFRKHREAHCNHHPGGLREVQGDTTPMTHKDVDCVYKPHFEWKSTRVLQRDTVVQMGVCATDCRMGYRQCSHFQGTCRGQRGQQQPWGGQAQQEMYRDSYLSIMEYSYPSLLLEYIDGVVWNYAIKQQCYRRKGRVKERSSTSLAEYIQSAHQSDNTLVSLGEELTLINTHFHIQQKKKAASFQLKRQKNVNFLKMFVYIYSNLI